MTALLTLMQLSLSLESRVILDKVSFDIKQGDFVTVIGPNGAGKSSLLKIIVGLQKPTKGSCQVAPQTRIGYMPQRLQLNEMMPLSVETFLKTSKDNNNLLEVVEKTHIQKLLPLSIDHLHKELKIAILMVSHDLHFVHRASQSVICLNKHVCCMGQPDHVKSSKAYQDLFPHYVGSEMLPYHHDHDHTHDVLGHDGINDECCDHV